MRTIILLLIGTLLISSCEKKNEIEIIPDYNAMYLPPEAVDIPVKLIDDEDKHIRNIESLIGKNFKPEDQAYYFFHSVLYINDKGIIEKVKYSKEEPDKDFGDADINPKIDKLFPHYRIS